MHVLHNVPPRRLQVRDEGHLVRHTLEVVDLELHARLHWSGANLCSVLGVCCRQQLVLVSCETPAGMLLPQDVSKLICNARTETLHCCCTQHQCGLPVSNLADGAAR